MIKLPNSIEPAVMAENIVHLRDEIAAVDAKTLPATTTATTGQILKLTGETKTPAWADEYSYTPPAYSTTEVNTGQKWIDGRDIYRIVLTGTFPEITTNTNVPLGTIDTNLRILNYNFILKGSSDLNILINNIRFYAPSSGLVQINTVSSSYSEADYICILDYVKDPVPGRAPEVVGATLEEMKDILEGSELSTEEVKKIRKKTTK